MGGVAPLGPVTGGGDDDDDGEDGWTWYSVNRINKTNRWLCYLPKPPTLGRHNGYSTCK